MDEFQQRVRECDLVGVTETWANNSVVVLEESPCPRGSSRTNFQVLVLVLVLGAQVLVLVLVLNYKSSSLSSSSEVQVLENFRGLSRLILETNCTDN